MAFRTPGETNSIKVSQAVFGLLVFLHLWYSLNCICACHGGQHASPLGPSQLSALGTPQTMIGSMLCVLRILDASAHAQTSGLWAKLCCPCTRDVFIVS
jgi:hypothetical protein